MGLDDSLIGRILKIANSGGKGFQEQLQRTHGKNQGDRGGSKRGRWVWLGWGVNADNCN